MPDSISDSIISPDNIELASIEPQLAEPLGARSARGFSLMAAQAITSKAVSFLGQLCLARLLFPNEFGLFGLALTVTSVITVFQDAGINDLLMQRHLTIRRWENAAFWLSLSLGLLCMGATWSIAPAAARFYGTPGLKSLLIVLSVAMPLTTLSIVPRAILASHFRFRALAVIYLIESGGTVVLSVILAAAKFGVYSLVLPRPIMAAICAIAGLVLARPALQRKPQLHRWPSLLSSAFVLTGASVAWMAVTQGDYMMLGRFHSPRAVGIYYFAYNLSAQAVVFFTLNMAGILMPALSKLQLEPARQLKAFLRANAAIAVIGLPFCLAQAILARPLITLVFGMKWADAVPVFQILTIVMCFLLGGYPSRNLMKAQGRFKTLLGASVVYGIVFLTTVGFAAARGNVITVAWAVTACAAVFEPLHVYLAIRPLGGGWKEMWNGYFAPLAAAAIAASAAVWILREIADPLRGAAWGRIVATGGVALVVYAGAISLWARESLNELIAHLPRKRPAD